jgi:hypothetical protein
VRALRWRQDVRRHAVCERIEQPPVLAPQRRLVRAGGVGVRSAQRGKELGAVARGDGAARDQLAQQARGLCKLGGVGDVVGDAQQRGADLVGAHGGRRGRLCRLWRVVLLLLRRCALLLRMLLGLPLRRCRRCGAAGASSLFRCFIRALTLLRPLRGFERGLLRPRNALRGGEIAEEVHFRRLRVNNAI